jgi:glutamate-1-semialdehyde 2,1-aminomutase
LLKNERERYLQLQPRSIELVEKAKQNFLYGVPMHWMNNWGTPVPLFAQHAQGAHFTCADNIDHTDFCLGDTGTMFGHSPQPLQKRLLRKPAPGSPPCYLLH